MNTVIICYIFVCKIFNKVLDFYRLLIPAKKERQYRNCYTLFSETVLFKSIQQ